MPAQHEVSASVLKASIDLLPFFCMDTGRLAAATHESGKKHRDREKKKRRKGRLDDSVTNMPKEA